MVERRNDESKNGLRERDLQIPHTPTPPDSRTPTHPHAHTPTLPHLNTPILSGSRIAAADDLYRRRGEPGAVEETVSLLTNSGGAASDYEIQWRLARALFFLGQEDADSNEKRRLHSIAVQAGHRAVSLDASRVEGHFWLGVNLALFAEASGGLRAARALLRARRELKRSAAISESYHGAGPLRVLGRLEHHAPMFLGGSRQRSLGYFERALATAANSVTMIYAAELLLAMGERSRASGLLQKVVSLPLDPEWEFENLRDRKTAQSMLDIPVSRQ